MLEAISKASDFLKFNGQPHWLSFIGNSGTGKTFLAEKVYAAAFECTGMAYHDQLRCGCQRTFWPKLVSKLRDGKYWLIDDLSDANLTFIDEIAAEHDPSGFARDKLCELLSRRVNKWTILTSNLSLKKLGEIDGRISSRMIRGDSVVVEFNCMDYSLRP